MTTEEITQLRHTHYNATVTSLRKVRSDLMVMRVRPDFPRPAHKPGQYSTLGMGFWEPRIPDVQSEVLAPGDERKLARRAYSISCSVLDDHHELLDIDRTDWLEFYIVLVRESGKKLGPALTPRLFLLREGDRLYLGEKITGHFTLDPVKPEDNVVFLATGTGEAPHNYLVWGLLRRGLPSSPAIRISAWTPMLSRQPSNVNTTTSSQRFRWSMLSNASYKQQAPI